LFGWIAEAVRRSGLSEAICLLDADGKEFVEIGRKVGLGVPFERTSELAGNEVAVVDIALHALLDG
jgi:CMP-N-acetylneuraminic acid synthetase